MFGSKINPSGAAADLGDEIANSLRLNDNDNAYVTKTYGSGSDQTTMWCSVWFKRGNLSTTQGLMGAYQNGSNLVMVYLNASDVLLVQGETGGVFSTSMTTVAKLRDTTGWYHLYWQINTTTGDSSIWLNGVEQELAGGSSKDSTSDTYVFGGAHQHLIGTIRNTAGTYFPFDGYIAMAQFGFGATQAATDFGRYSTTHTNTWVPIDASGVTYGANGVLLDFTVAPGTGNGAGTDTSGNANHFTDTNLAADDQSSDTPTNVFATASPINKGTESVTFSEGNTKLVGVGNNSSNSSVAGTIAMTAGKYYWEQKFTGAQTSGVQALGCGIFNADNERVDQVSYATSTNKLTFYTDNNNIEDLSGTGTDYVGSITDQTSATVGFAVDFDNGWAWVHVNGTYINGVPTFTDGTNAIQSSIPSGTWLPFWFQNGGTTSKTWEINFGTTPVGAGGNADDNGYGDFDYAPPSGFLALCQANLPNVVTDLGGVDKPYEHFKASTRTGDATADATTVSEFDPVLVWIKNRDQADEHKIVDQVRGATKELNSDSTNAESTDANGVTAFGTNSYTLGTGAGGYNDNTENFVDWIFDGNGAGVSNTNGTITSTVSVSPSGAWSFGTFTGTGANGTVGHGLGGVDMLFIKELDNANPFVIYHKDVAADAETDFLRLDATDAAADDALMFNDTAPTATVFTVSTNNSVNRSSGRMFFMAFRSVPGICKVTKHVGNASADGPFIPTDFAPAFIMSKSTGIENWIMLDDARPGYNPTGNYLFANLTNAEAGAGGEYVDRVSNGIKIRTTGASINGSGVTFIDLIFGQSAIGGGIPFPNAR